MLLTLLLACTGDIPKDTAADSPTVTFLDPIDGDVVPVGDVAVSVIVDGFTLTSPAKHNEGAPEGYIAVSVDGAEVLTASETQFTVTLSEAGAHTIAAELFYADGDALEPPVSAEIGVTAE